MLDKELCEKTGIATYLYSRYSSCPTPPPSLILPFACAFESRRQEVERKGGGGETKKKKKTDSAGRGSFRPLSLCSLVGWPLHFFPLHSSSLLRRSSICLRRKGFLLLIQPPPPPSRSLVGGRPPNADEDAPSPCRQVLKPRIVLYQ